MIVPAPLNTTSSEWGARSTRRICQLKSRNLHLPCKPVEIVNGGVYKTGPSKIFPKYPDLYTWAQNLNSNVCKTAACTATSSSSSSIVSSLTPDAGMVSRLSCKENTLDYMGVSQNLGCPSGVLIKSTQKQMHTMLASILGPPQ